MRGTMNAKEKRIAIAELCGWKPGEDDRMKDGTYRWDIRANGVIFGSKPMTYIDSDEFCGSYLCDQKVPDYINDLNAVREAEEVILKQGLQDTWLDCLVEVVVGKNVHWSDYHCFPQVSRATAEQRADAILLVMERAGS